MTEEVIRDGLCYCQDEGAQEAALGICPLHMPTDHNKIRQIVKYYVDDAYKRGYEDAKDKLFEAFHNALEDV